MLPSRYMIHRGTAPMDFYVTVRCPGFVSARRIRKAERGDDLITVFTCEFLEIRGENMMWELCHRGIGHLTLADFNGFICIKNIWKVNPSLEWWIARLCSTPLQSESCWLQTAWPDNSALTSNSLYLQEFIWCHREQLTHSPENMI